jgi:hypothetical protein
VGESLNLHSLSSQGVGGSIGASLRHRPSFIARIALALPPDIFGPEETWGASRWHDFARSSLVTAPSGSSSLLQRCHPKTGGRPAKETCRHFCSPNRFLGGHPSQASGAQRRQAHRPQNQFVDQCSWLPRAACCVMLRSSTAVSRHSGRRQAASGICWRPRRRRDLQPGASAASSRCRSGGRQQKGQPLARSP